VASGQEDRIQESGDPELQTPNPAKGERRTANREPRTVNRERYLTRMGFRAKTTTNNFKSVHEPRFAFLCAVVNGDAVRQG
jgi:hypothetical protein